MALNQKIKRTIFAHKSQYIGATVMIVLSCMLFAVFHIMGSNVLNNLELFKTKNVQEDAYFILDGGPPDISALEEAYDVRIEQRGAADVQYTDDATLRILSATEKIDRYEVVAGADMEGDGELLVDPEFAKAHDIAIGSGLELFGESFRVTGYVSTPDYIYPLKNASDFVKNPEAFGIAVVSKESFEKLGRGYTFYSVKYGDTDVDAFKSVLAGTSTIVSWVDKENNMRISFIEGDLKGIGPIGTVLPVAILVVTCAMVAVVLWRLLRQEFSQIGVLYAIGYRKREILRHYMTYAVVISAFGGLPGTALGALLVRPFVAYVSTFYNLPVMHVNYQPLVFALSVALPFLLLMPTSLFVILKALRMSPLVLMKGGIKKTKINFFERILKLRHLRFNTKFKIREVVRNIPRTLLLLLGVVCASALLLLGFSVKDSMDDLLNGSFKTTFLYDSIYTFGSLQSEAPEGGEKVALSAFTLQQDGKEESVVMFGIQEDAKLINLSDSDGSKLDYDQVIVTKALADKYGISPGDSIDLQSSISLKKISLRVDEIAAYHMGNFIYMPLDRFNEMMGYPAGSYLQLYADKTVSISDSDLVSATSREYVESGYESMLSPIRAMAGIIGVLSFVIGLIILYVVTSLLIEENKDSISLLKVLGYDRKRLYMLMLNPYTGFVIAGYALSVPLIVVSLGQFFDTMTAEMSMRIPARLTVLSALFGFIIIFLTYQLTKWMNRRKINRISMSESLKSARE